MIRLLSYFLLAFVAMPLTGCGAEPSSTNSQPAAQQAPSAPTAEQRSSAPASAPAVDFQAGQHYEVLRQPVRTDDPERIEVVEVFWYGCGHCYTFKPMVEEWAETLGDDVAKSRLPAVWHPVMELHARAYYTAESLGVVDKIHTPIFEAMNLRGEELDNKKDIAELFEAAGVSREEFEQTFDSFGINSAITRGDSRQRAYGTRGTPELIVNGKYRITGTMAGSHAGMLQVADHLIEMERNSRQSD